jgi:hypothetical protein
MSGSDPPQYMAIAGENPLILTIRSENGLAILHASAPARQHAGEAKMPSLRRSQLLTAAAVQ